MAYAGNINARNAQRSAARCARQAVVAQLLAACGNAPGVLRRIAQELGVSRTCVCRAPRKDRFRFPAAPKAAAGSRVPGCGPNRTGSKHW